MISNRLVITMFQLTLILLSLNMLLALAAFDYYKVALQWPGTFCKAPKANCHLPYPTNFRIHGLWPSNLSTIPVINCPNTASFDATKMLPTALSSQLNLEWPNLNGNNKDFWQHEWVKHGTCSTFSLQPLAYFSETLKIKAMIGDLKGVLATAHIVPSATAFYNRELIRNATKLKIDNKVPELSCKMNPVRPPQPPGAPRYADLAEVRVCLDINLEYMDCPIQYTPSCTQMIYWPV